MTCGTLVIAGVPASALSQVLGGLGLEDPQPVSINKTPTPDGRSDITCVFPSCPDGSHTLWTVVYDPNPPAEYALGKLSAKYESGNRGPGTISSGRGDRGGVSYGTWQMTSTGPGGGTVGRFARQPGLRWTEQFAGLTPGSEPFSRLWLEIAREGRDVFQDAQYRFIKQTHYDVLVDSTLSSHQYDVESGSRVLRDVFWSTAVQMGPNTAVIREAWKELTGPAPQPGVPEDEKRVIKAIYNERGRADTDGALHYFTSNSPQVQASVAQRFRDELADALRELV